MNAPIELEQKDVTTLDLATLWSQTKRMLEAVLAENAQLKQQLIALTHPASPAAPTEEPNGDTA